MKVFLFLPIWMAMAWLGCSSVSGFGDEIPAEGKDSVRDVPEEPTLDGMIGQMIMVGMPGTSTEKNTLLLEALAQGKAGGVILFEKNIAPENSAAMLRQLIMELQNASAQPLLIAIDQEGGKVNRLKVKYGFPDSKSASWLGKKNNCDTTSLYAGQTASTLAGLGINLNFAPVVDLCVNPDNPVIATKERCYSDDPMTVAMHARCFIDAHLAQGVLTTLKHFPGHGSSTRDTHLELTDVTQHWTRDELIPYRELIRQQKADAVMTAHIVNCKLDTSCLPATLSGSIINGLLRDSLGYKGVVFTDDMQMKAITQHYGLENAIRLAILAGVDVLLFSNNIPGSTEHQAAVVHRIIRDMVDNGQIPEAQIRNSYKRIIALKRKIFPQYIFPG